ncbi:hypothetical protein [Psychrobacillus sp. NPDC093200]|uniref:hypothetical protein n=1 Tax=Psychrobacillus sp. NPDC093200 TaxID=3390656 RepID=UPI003D0876FC
MKKKKSMFSILGILLVLSLSFGTSASAQVPAPEAGGGTPIKCIPGKPCPIGP